MPAPATITPTLPGEQTPGVVMVALAEIHCRRLQAMADGVAPLPRGRSVADALTALRAWRGILAAQTGGGPVLSR